MSTLDIEEFVDDDPTDDHSLPDREGCDRCGEDLPCWWHFLAADPDISIERVERRRREQGVTG